MNTFRDNIRVVRLPLIVMVWSLGCTFNQWGQPVCASEISDEIGACEGDPEPRHHRCMPSEVETSTDEIAPGQCVPSVEFEGAEIFVDSDCLWIVCIEPQQSTNTCLSTQTDEIVELRQRLEERFESLGGDDATPFDFTKPEFIGVTCEPKAPLDGKCCYPAIFWDMCGSSIEIED